MEQEIFKKLNKYDMVVGVDEVGRGPIAGPVTVCAFTVSRQYYKKVFKELEGITDSKKLTEKKREFFTEKIRDLKNKGYVDVVVSSISAHIIDTKGIIPALRSAVNRSLEKISQDENIYVFLDGSLFAPDTYSQETIIKGDAKNWLIGAASVVAKVSRDNYMKELSKKIPEYSFEKHKGYGTKAHYDAIKKHGMCEFHRKSWIKI